MESTELDLPNMLPNTIFSKLFGSENVASGFGLLQSKTALTHLLQSRAGDGRQINLSQLSLDIPMETI
jgi:hypothetical protein